jgi:hypothetical protein
LVQGQGKNQLMKSESLQSGGIVLQKMTGVFDSNSVAKPSQHNSSPSNNHSATEYKLYTLEGFLHIIYIPFITKPSVKVSLFTY